MLQNHRQNIIKNYVRYFHNQKRDSLKIIPAPISDYTDGAVEHFYSGIERAINRYILHGFNQKSVCINSIETSIKVASKYNEIIWQVIDDPK